MKDIRIIFGHMCFYGEVALKSFGLFLSYTLLLVFYPVTTMLRKFNRRVLTTTQWPVAVSSMNTSARGR